MVTSEPSVQPGHAVVGPHREQNSPADGSSGSSVHAGRSLGPRPWKSQPQFAAQTGPIRDPESGPPKVSAPNHETLEVEAVGL